MNAKIEVFDINNIKENDVLIFKDGSVGIAISHNLVDVAGKKRFIHELESNILKIKRKKCTLASLNVQNGKLCKEPSFRRKVSSVYYNKYAL